MNNEIKNAVAVTDIEAQYDTCAKRLLGNKDILAHILVTVVDEFKGMRPREAIKYIEGEPIIGVIPVEPGLTNSIHQTDGNRIVGFNTESVEINEGEVRFDIIFYARTNNGLSKIIVNIEAQKDEPTSYQILNRAIYYVCRQISSQKQREFTGTDYDSIKKVYSIWICMNMKENSLCHYHMTGENIIGSHKWKGNADLINIIMIGLSEKLPKKSKGYELHRLLGTLLSKILTKEEKLEIIESEYDITENKIELRKEVNTMCNLSQGIKEWGIAIGEKRSISEIVLAMHKKGLTSEQIAEMIDKDINMIEEILAI